eukprot:10247762-Alexandrium_andersonii.AAC.1
MANTSGWLGPSRLQSPNLRMRACRPPLPTGRFGLRCFHHSLFDTMVVAGQGLAVQGSHQVGVFERRTGHARE